MKAFKGNCIIQTMFLKGSYKGQDVYKRQVLVRAQEHLEVGDESRGKLF